ncbi:hypothetical protein D3C78_1236890 [compost metagenome]
MLADRHQQGRQQAEQVQRQQHAVELVQPAHGVAEDQQHAVHHHDQVGLLEAHRAGVVVEGHRHHRALEGGVVDGGGAEQQGRQGGAGAAEQPARELRHRQPTGNGVAADHRVDRPVADHRQQQADDRVARAEAHRQGGADHQVEHRAADAPPGHGQRAAAEALIERYRAIGTRMLVCRFSGHDRSLVVVGRNERS